MKGGRGKRETFVSLLENGRTMKERRSFLGCTTCHETLPRSPVPYICKSCRPIVSLFTLPPFLNNDKKIQVKLSSG